MLIYCAGQTIYGLLLLKPNIIERWSTVRILITRGCDYGDIDSMALDYPDR